MKNLEEPSMKLFYGVNEFECVVRTYDSSCVAQSVEAERMSI